MCKQIIRNLILFPQQWIYQIQNVFASFFGTLEASQHNFWLKKSFHRIEVDRIESEDKEWSPLNLLETIQTNVVFQSKLQKNF